MLSLLSDWICVKGSKLPTLNQEWKTTFPGKRGKLWNFSKSFSQFRSYLKICSKIYRKTKSNIFVDRILVQDWKIQNFINNYKTIFMRNRSKLSNFCGTFLQYWSYKFINLFWNVSTGPNEFSEWLIFVQGSNTSNLIYEYQTVFLGKHAKS